VKAGTFISVVWVSLALATSALAQSPAVPPTATDQQQPQPRADTTDRHISAQAATPDEVQALHTALRARLADLRH
jgi:hypothetical protein